MLGRSDPLASAPSAWWVDVLVCDTPWLFAADTNVCSTDSNLSPTDCSVRDDHRVTLTAATVTYLSLELAKKAINGS